MRGRVFVPFHTTSDRRPVTRGGSSVVDFRPQFVRLRKGVNRSKQGQQCWVRMGGQPLKADADGSASVGPRRLGNPLSLQQAPYYMTCLGYMPFAYVWLATMLLDCIVDLMLLIPCCNALLRNMKCIVRLIEDILNMGSKTHIDEACWHSASTPEFN